MPKLRKAVMLLHVKVTVPRGMTTRHAAREVRTLVSEQCNYDAEPGDVRVLACKPAPRIGTRVRR